MADEQRRGRDPYPEGEQLNDPHERTEIGLGFRETLRSPQPPEMSQERPRALLERDADRIDRIEQRVDARQSFMERMITNALELFHAQAKEHTKMSGSLHEAHAAFVRAYAELKSVGGQIKELGDKLEEYLDRQDAHAADDVRAFAEVKTAVKNEIKSTGWRPWQTRIITTAIVAMMVLEGYAVGTQRGCW
jgi:hypothetical protein